MKESEFRSQRPEPQKLVFSQVYFDGQEVGANRVCLRQTHIILSVI